MRTKLYLLFGSVALLFIVFLLVEDRKEDLTEITYWKLSLDKLEYLPPSKEWMDDSGETFYKTPFSISLKEGVKKGGQFFLVSSLDKETEKKIEYEGGYNAENTFRDLGQLKVKDSESIAEGVPISSSLDLGDGAPRLILYSGNRTKTLRFGKKHSNGSTRIVLEEGTPRVLLSAYSYIFDRFQKGPDDFRQRQLVFPGKESVKEIYYLEEGGKPVRIDNHPYQENGAKRNYWRRVSGKIILLDPNVGEDLYRAAINLRVELYPDQEKGAGFKVGSLLAPEGSDSQYSLATMKILLTEGDEITFRFHKPTEIGDKKYVPTIRIWNGSFREPPFYVTEESFRKIKESAGRIELAAPKISPPPPKKK
ncbi:PF14238 domain protein [Leptospira inadai serovar Lyme str. 10]|uniref:PF14238 domain protein n=2 Tax=Leptospira inadai serovar Lyme TaxID=293084 RepID=V6HSS4_9LEPT|nr:hypothetical protein [Leptospira inadai]EQA35684.1 PF14238 domain protein [Leptospira inadai serovar Lyme str. 10]PNV75977.1 hypothetical protein BES34_005575 [Leptospira inadai serovar Lyme]